MHLSSLCVSSVLEYLVLEKRIQTAMIFPKFRKYELSTPLKVETLRFAPSRVTINSIKFVFGEILEIPENTSMSEEEKSKIDFQNSNGGYGWMSCEEDVVEDGDIELPVTNKSIRESQKHRIIREKCGGLGFKQFTIIDQPENGKEKRFIYAQRLADDLSIRKAFKSFTTFLFDGRRRNQLQVENLFLNGSGIIGLPDYFYLELAYQQIVSSVDRVTIHSLANEFAFQQEMIKKCRDLYINDLWIDQHLTVIQHVEHPRITIFGCRETAHIVELISNWLQNENRRVGSTLIIRCFPDCSWKETTRQFEDRGFSFLNINGKRYLKSSKTDKRKLKLSSEFSIKSAEKGTSVPLGSLRFINNYRLEVVDHY